MFEVTFVYKLEYSDGFWVECVGVLMAENW